jgi:hypothetical protein
MDKIKLRVFKPFSLSQYQDKWAIDLYNENNPLTYFNSYKDLIDFIDKKNCDSRNCRKFILKLG